MLNTSDGFLVMLMLVTLLRELCFMVTDSISVLGVGLALEHQLSSWSLTLVTTPAL